MSEYVSGHALNWARLWDERYRPDAASAWYCFAWPEYVVQLPVRDADDLVDLSELVSLAPKGEYPRVERILLFQQFSHYVEVELEEALREAVAGIGESIDECRRVLVVTGDLAVTRHGHVLLLDHAGEMTQAVAQLAGDEHVCETRKGAAVVRLELPVRLHDRSL